MHVTNSSVTSQQPARWVVRTAHLIILLPLPSALWRLGLVLGLTMGIRVAAGVDYASDMASGSQALAILSLTLISEGVGLLTLGLVRPWGEVFPRRWPLIGGRPVPRTATTVLAMTGALALTAIWTFAMVNFFILTIFGAPTAGFVFDNGWWEALMISCYLPLLVWGPLLLVLIGAYHRRRRRHAEGP